MSDKHEIHNVVILNSDWGIAYSQMIDTLKPKHASKCYISISKFDAIVPLPAGYSAPSHLVALFVPGVETCYYNDPHSNVVVRSQMVETFWSNELAGGKAIHRFVSQADNWVKMNQNDLNDFRLNFRTTNLDEFVSPIEFSALPNFHFSLHLKIKFE